MRTRPPKGFVSLVDEGGCQVFVRASSITSVCEVWKDSTRRTSVACVDRDLFVDTSIEAVLRALDHVEADHG